MQALAKVNYTNKTPLISQRKVRTSPSRSQQENKLIVHPYGPLGNGDSVHTLESSDKQLGLKKMKITKKKMHTILPR